MVISLGEKSEQEQSVVEGNPRPLNLMAARIAVQMRKTHKGGVSMKSIFRIGQRSSRIAIALMLAAFSLTVVTLPAQATSITFQQVNLVSDIPGLALHTDPDLVNPWGSLIAAPAPSGFPTTVRASPRFTTAPARSWD